MNKISKIIKIVIIKLSNLIKCQIYMDCFRGAFDYHKAYFVHIPKAAGSSISLSIFGHQVGHMSYQKLYHLDKNKTKNYFSFAFVREPIDRFVSAYAYLESGGMGDKEQLIYEKKIKPFGDINNFIKKIDRNKINEIQMFRPQYLFLCSDRSIHPQVSFVGRYENLKNDFAYIKSKLNINTTLEEKNSSTKSNQNRYALNSESVDILKKMYAMDYYIFGYNL